MKLYNSECDFATCRSDLYQLCAAVQDKVNTVVEVGSLAGFSTIVFAQYFEVISIDPYIPGYAKGDLNAGEKRLKMAEQYFSQHVASLPNVTQHKELSGNAAKTFNPNSLQLVYIDADHTYKGVKADIDSWLPKIKPGKFLAGHDFNLPEVERAVRELNKEVSVFKGDHWLITK